MSTDDGHGEANQSLFLSLFFCADGIVFDSSHVDFVPDVRLG